MSDTKFTKGPWGIIENCVGSIEVVFGNGSACRGDEYLSIYPTSSKNDFECIHTGETAEANAHLIAAAPEMYEMLESISENPSETNVIHIKKLLAKARGESNE